MLQRFVIDEAHCVSQWFVMTCRLTNIFRGYDFRPDYIELRVLKEQFPEIPILGVTAAATPSVRADILRHLQLFECEFFTQSFNRRNL